MERDYNNYKPYRTKAQKEVARKTATKDVNGHWHSNAPVSFHPVKKDLLKSLKKET
jgi:hypothetical protein